ncbi:MAG: hypothetical protein CMB80_28330 [Flammeovirgaceae bacterium]|nr:hypothetical protein [Flammeovirgaceae bacterium]MBR07158.1 hypothetical protein [Rickettsiales bacterium]HCX23612.1 hypothetical protein [Cytophagales bacterium]
MALFAISCAEPVQPTPTNMSYGDWSVVEVYVDGQAETSYSGSLFERFTLERDDTFIVVDRNGLAYVGTWVATDTSLTLTADDGTVFSFTIVFQSYEKLHLLQTISSPTAGDIVIRYLMDQSDANKYSS